MTTENKTPSEVSPAGLTDTSKYEVRSWYLKVNWWGHIDVPLCVYTFSMTEMPDYVVKAINKYVKTKLEPKENAMGSPLVREAEQRMLGKKPYRVRASETVYYEKIVWAESEEDAEDIVRNGEESMDYDDISEGDYFEVHSAEVLR